LISLLFYFYLFVEEVPVDNVPIAHEVPLPVEQKTIDPGNLLNNYYMSLINCALIGIKALKLHCPVCADDEVDSGFIHPCGHVLCKEHFTEVHNKKNECPLCKENMNELTISPDFGKSNCFVTFILSFCVESVLFQCVKCKSVPGPVDSKSDDNESKKLHVCCYKTKDGGKSPEHVFCSECYKEIMKMDAKDCTQRLPLNTFSYVRYPKDGIPDSGGRLMLKKKHLKYFGQTE
jgi:Zinc finger, C3HC4 type (RING finger)